MKNTNIVQEKIEKITIAGSGEIVAFAQEGMPSLEVWLEDDSIWLTQKQMALLFGCSDENIRLHVKTFMQSAN